MPLPGCLEELLSAHVLRNAKRDKLALVKAAFEVDDAVEAGPQRHDAPPPSSFT